MTLFIFLCMGIFIVAIQTAMPYLLKRTIVFGVTIPMTHTDESTLSSYKRLYALLTASIGILAFGAFTLWALSTNTGEETVVLAGTAIQFAFLLLSMALYFLFHAKVSRLKQKNKWGTDLKQVRIADVAVRTADEMLPWTIYLLPMLITIGIIAYTVTQYAHLPELIPTHWGIDGQPDAFSKKTPFSSVALLLILLIMQGMMLGINEMTKRSGIKISATQKRKSRAQQLSFRKYTSWFLFATALLITVLFSFLQLSTIHENIGNPALLFALPIGFLVIIFIMTGIYAFKVGQSGTRLEIDIIDQEVEGITDYDDDRYWKGGLFYFNRNDPSIFVEKRFGVGWTINFGHPIGYLVLFVPILLILVISFSI